MFPQRPPSTCCNSTKIFFAPGAEIVFRQYRPKAVIDRVTEHSALRRLSAAHCEGKETAVATLPSALSTNWRKVGFFRSPSWPAVMRVSTSSGVNLNRVGIDLSAKAR